MAKRKTRVPMVTHARAYKQAADEQQLPYHVQLKRTRAQVRFYRAQVQQQIHQYRLWLALSDFLRRSGQDGAPRTHAQFANRIRKALAQYRAHRAAESDLLERRAQALQVSAHRFDLSAMTEQALYEYLERRYGPGFAQNVMNEMGKIAKPHANFMEQAVAA